MTQSNVMVLHVHKNYTDELCMANIGNEFVRSSAFRLVVLFWLRINYYFGMTTPTIVGVSVGVVSWPLHFPRASYTYDLHWPRRLLELLRCTGGD